MGLIQCADGSTPNAALVTDNNGNLYGTTWSGGLFGDGTVFQYNVATGALHTANFCGQGGGVNCLAGSNPYAGLILGHDGNFYGTTVGGGAYNAGTVFQVSFDSNGNATFNTVYSFCKISGCADGAAPYGGLVEDSNNPGHFYGTTDRGGGQDNMGTVFELCSSRCSSAESGTAAPTETSDSSPIATITFNLIQSPHIIQPNFMSIAHDLIDTPNLMTQCTYTSSSCNCPYPLNPIYKNLIGQLVSDADVPLSIRLLSDAGDLHYKQYYPDYVCALPTLLSPGAIRNFFVGVDFYDYVKNNDTSFESQAADLHTILGGTLVGIEGGNEPDEYNSTDPRSVTRNMPTPIKDSPLLLHRRSKSSSLPRCGPPGLHGKNCKLNYFMPQLNSFITASGPTLSMVVIHHYSGKSCNDDQRVLPTYLLDSQAVDHSSQPDSDPAYVGLNYVPAARNAKLPLRIGELNSVNCGGQEGVSNSFSSALWAMDISFAYAKAGVSGVNFFDSANPKVTHPYSPFDFTRSGDTYYVRDINPLYYGMLMFKEAVQNNARLLQSQVTSESKGISAWATVDLKGTIRLLLINKDLNVSGNVNVSIGSRIPYNDSGPVVRLTAPFYYSITGVSLGGQTFDGSPRRKPSRNAVYRVG